MASEISFFLTETLSNNSTMELFRNLLCSSKKSDKIHSYSLFLAENAIQSLVNNQNFVHHLHKSELSSILINESQFESFFGTHHSEIKTNLSQLLNTIEFLRSKEFNQRLMENLTNPDLKVIKI